MHSSFPSLNNQRSAVFRITEAAERALLKLLFSRHPRREWGTFIRFGYRRTPWGVALSFVEALPPGPDDLDRTSAIVEFRPAYIRRALRSLVAIPVAFGVIHSHPLGAATLPSRLDDDMDLYFGELSSAYEPDHPYVSLIVNQTRAGGLHFSGRVCDRGEWIPVLDWHTVGPQRLGRIHSDLWLASQRSIEFFAESPVARLETLFGEVAAIRLRNSRVAILGCSGTGSPVAELLARAGVSDFLLVDYQNFAPSNLERLHGSTFAHAQAAQPPPKVVIVAELIRSINPAAKITAFVGNILDDEIWDLLVRCDLVMSCTDTDHSRAALGDLAKHYLVPSIDVSVLMEGEHGKVTGQVIECVQYAPDLPCAFCDRRINNQRLLTELLSEEEKSQRRAAAEAAAARGDDASQYWAGDAPQIPTVGYLTTCAGSLSSGYAIGWLTGAATPPANRFQIDIGVSGFGYVAPIRQPRPHCSTCNKYTGGGDQSITDRSISRPAHWPLPQRKN